MPGEMPVYYAGTLTFHKDGIRKSFTGQVINYDICPEKEEKSP
jgi:hypothetical protein